MPKKKTAAAKRTSKRPGRRPGSSPVVKADRVKFEMRFDRGVYEGMQRFADRVGISVNQVMEAMGMFVAEHGKLGEAYRDENGVVLVRPQPGCFFFGEEGRYQWVRNSDGQPLTRAEDSEGEWDDAHREAARKGQIIRQFDFTVRRVMVSPRKEDES